MLTKVDFAGDPYVGVFSASNDVVLLVAPSVPEKAVREAEAALGVRAVQTTVGGSNLVGSLVALNSRALLAAAFAQPAELERVEALDIYTLDHRLNAVGNNLLVNDSGALCHPGYGRRALREMEDVFGVEVHPATIGGVKTVGSAAVVNNRGALCHPHATEEELAVVEDVLRVPAMIGTANYGTPQLGACLVANDQGAVTGTPTTPIELGRIEEGLRLF